MLGDDPFALLNGDIFTDFDFSRLPQTLPPHLGAHLLLTPTPASRTAGDFGFAHRRVNRHSTDFVYCGISVMRHNFAMPPAGSDPRNDPNGGKDTAFSLQGPLFRAADSGRLSAGLLNAQWSDIGTLAELEKLRAQHSP